MIELSADFLVATQETARNAIPWFWLFELQLVTDTTQDRWVLLAGTDEDVTFDGRTYHAYPVRLDVVAADTAGELPETQLVIANFHGLAARYLQNYNGLIGKRVVARLARADLLSDPLDTLPIEYEVTEASASHEAVQLSLGQVGLNDIQAPIGRYHRDTCRFRYVVDGHGRCGYSGALTTCARTLVACDDHGNARRFGGFPSIPGAA